MRDGVTVCVADGEEEWYGQVVIFFVAEEQQSAIEKTDPPRWAEYAYIRYLEQVVEADLQQHPRVHVQQNSSLIWQRVLACNKAKLTMMRWTIIGDAGFQCHPYTTGWGVIPAKLISHRVVCQEVQLKELVGYFWLNEVVDAFK